MNTQIYIALLEEGLACWRPASADHLRDDIYLIQEKHTPSDENLEFVAGEVVRCRTQTFGDGNTGLVAYERVNA